MLDGICWGFSSQPKPWTAEEQKKAVDIQKDINIFDKIYGLSPIDINNIKKLIIVIWDSF
ncbi:MAG: hypothetical protein K2H74_05580 [Paramuribaculum sp.]|nr:hypothetical protein [Paramuribaculum sp.]